MVMISVFVYCSDLADAKSRALDNLGRVHARSGEFARAIEVSTVLANKLGYILLFIV